MDKRCSLIPPPPFLSGKKWSSDLFGTRPWAEFELISWKWSILSGILHLNSSKGKENSIWNWWGRNINIYSAQLDARSQLSFLLLWRTEQICWRRVMGLAILRRPVHGLGPSLISSHVVNLDSRSRTGIEAQLRFRLCTQMCSLEIFLPNLFLFPIFPSVCFYFIHLKYFYIWGSYAWTQTYAFLGIYIHHCSTYKRNHYQFMSKQWNLFSQTTSLRAKHELRLVCLKLLILLHVV